MLFRKIRLRGSPKRITLMIGGPRGKVCIRDEGFVGFFEYFGRSSPKILSFGGQSRNNHRVFLYWQNYNLTVKKRLRMFVLVRKLRIKLCFGWKRIFFLSSFRVQHIFPSPYIFNNSYPSKTSSFPAVMPCFLLGCIKVGREEVMLHSLLFLLCPHVYRILYYGKYVFWNWSWTVNRYGINLDAVEKEFSFCQ